MKATRIINGMTFAVEIDDTVTAQTLIKISMTGDADRMTCRACNESEAIAFIGLGCGKQFRKGNPQRDKLIRAFKKRHLESCLALSDAEVSKHMKKRAI